MKIKRYLARDMREAMLLIKEDLGPDAVILASKPVRDRGLWGLFRPRRIEVTAALDEVRKVSKPSGAPPPAPAPAAAALNLRPAEARSAEARPQPDAYSEGYRSVLRNVGTADGGGFGMQQELAQMKALVDRMTGQNGTAATGDTFFNWWEQFLLANEIETDIVDGIMQAMHARIDPADNERFDLARVCIQDEIINLVTPAYANQGLGRVVAFVGPTGVGKTTTLAKLAAQYTLFHGKSTALVTIDTYRIGAVEQLQIYADIIGVPLEVANAPGQLKEAVARHAGKDFVFVDTAGRPSRKTGKIGEIKSHLSAIGEPVRIILCQSCSTKHRDLVRIQRDFSFLDYSALIFTKLDETETTGSILNTVRRTGLPVTHVTNGQGMPEDIEVLYPKKLAKLLTRGAGLDA